MGLNIMVVQNGMFCTVVVELKGGSGGRLVVVVVVVVVLVVHG